MQTTTSPGRASAAERVLVSIGALALASVLALSGVQHYWLRELKFDDAFIHYRYAEHLASGDGFVYNPGERVLGSGGALWNFLLAGLAWLAPAGTLPQAVTLLNFALLVACAGALVVTLKRLAPVWVALVATAAILSHGPLPVSSIGGTETVLLSLLYFVCLRALLDDRFVLAGLAAGAACGLRVESGGMIAAVLLATWFHRRRALGPAGLATLGPPVILHAWLWLYFGSPLASSTLAKHLVYTQPPLRALNHCGGALLSVLPLDGVFRLLSLSPGAARTGGLAAWAGLIVLGTWRLRRTFAPASFVVLQVASAVVFYAVANPLMFPWYHCTFVPLATVLAVTGLVQLGRGLCRTPRWLPHGLAAAAVAGLSVAPTRAMLTPFVPPGSPAFSFRNPNARGSARTYQYARLARWLNRRARPGDRVCLPEIGAFGYYFRGPILDAMGLVSPEALPYHPLPEGLRRDGTYGAIPPRLVRDLEPEFVVSMDIFAEAVFADPWFRGHYERVGRFPWFGGPAPWRDLPAALWGGREMLAYRRLDVPWPAPSRAPDGTPRPAAAISGPGGGVSRPEQGSPR